MAANPNMQVEQVEPAIERQLTDVDGKNNKVVQIGQLRVMGLSSEDEDFYVNFPVKDRAALVRKIDLRLTPMLAMLYLLSHLDRANIGNANIEGLSKDLDLTGVQYNTALGILFVTYITFEVPSNMILKRFTKPSQYMAFIVISWGMVMTFTGVVQNYAGLVVCRLLLGLFEAGFFPAAVYILTQWYMPQELATRLSYMYLTSAVAGAFSGLLAAGIAEMDGIGGYEGWRWIFILEGLATVVLGVATWFWLADSPVLSKWLTREEKRYLEVQHFIKDGGLYSTQQRKNDWKVFLSILTDWKIYGVSALLFVNIAAGYGVKLTMPAIIKGMGFQNRAAQLMTAPPYALGAISTVISSKISDRFYRRMPFVVIPWTIFIIGYAIIMSYGANTAKNVGPCYFGVFLICIGLFPVNPAITSWAANNITPASKRAVGVAFFNCVGNIGGILGSFMFLEKEAPAYPTGYGTSIGVLAAGILIAIGLEAAFIILNKRRDRVPEEEVRAKYTEQQLSDMGDKSPLYRYTL
ncbi:unnamed protein product [Clonostachys byssicola]|uniref:Major facilitator superfamily (MFS) profile domain-containing protein n=1 Tax=Clonostachys byssicola TaxID=160290 RepID=A0A9N9UM37_9HYPO|nr:unnamed protein product [Clonostachys byssicola]